MLQVLYAFNYCLRLFSAVLFFYVIFSLRFTESTVALSKDITIQTHIKSTEKIEIEKLLQTGKEQFRRSQFREALATYQKVLAICQQMKDRTGEAETLTRLGEIYNNLSQYPKALETLQKALTIHQAAGNKLWEGITLKEIGITNRELGEYSKAQAVLKQALAIFQSSANQEIQGSILYNLGLVYSRLGEYQQAQQLFQQALEIAQIVSDKIGEGRAINGIGIVYDSLGKYPEAIEVLEKALPILREIGDRLGEQRILNTLGVTSRKLSQYQQALQFHQQSLAIAREIGNRAEESRNLHNIGSVYSLLGNYRQALEFYQQSLAIAVEISDRPAQGRTLIGIGILNDNQGQYQQARESYQQALAILQKTGDKAGVGITFNNIGGSYYSQGEYQKALESYQQALEIARNLGERASEGRTLSNIGGTYFSLGQYPQALEFYRQALKIRHQIGDKAGEGNTLNRIGAVYDTLGQYSQSLDFYQQALTIRRKIGDRPGEAVTLNNIGEAHRQLKQYSEALNFYQQAVSILREIGDRTGEGIAFNNMGIVYSQLGQSAQALEFYQQALNIRQAVGDKAGLGATLNNIGTIYDNQSQYAQALEYYRKALSITREIGDLAGEASTLNNIGNSLKKYNQPDLAIVFYKQSVNVTESIRQNLQKLSQEQQESYTQTVADIYRSLADLLLSQGRILEAQQVLELLKVEELRDFTKKLRAGENLKNISLSATEEKILQSHNSLIAFGQQLEECQKTRCQQLSQLLDRRDTLTVQYNQTVQQLEKEIRARRTADEAFLDPTKLGRKAQEILKAQPGTVLIYPFVLEDKIWLLWASSGGIVRTVEVGVTRRQLGESVLKFRQLLRSPISNIPKVKETGKQLYGWLIKPLEAELRTNQIQNLVFSLDRVTRYIPMSALFDGKKYLVENYAISTILSADLTDTRDRLPAGTQNTSVLALGLSNAVAGFNSLPNVTDEINALVKLKPTDPTGIYPGLKFLNTAFDFPALRDHLQGRNILHIATHGQFLAGRPDDSFLLLGTGEKLKIPQIDTLQDLVDVHLVVLSACETALGGPDSDGVEIAGISYYFLNRGAKAVIASLWKVNDSSTSQLMEYFYRNLAQATEAAPISKAEALRQAQLTLITGNVTTRQQPGNVVPSGSLGSLPSPFGQSFRHPFYWSPFILIGNGL